MSPCLLSSYTFLFASLLLPPTLNMPRTRGKARLVTAPCSMLRNCISDLDIVVKAAP